MRTHVLREYLCENEKFRETIFACLYGAQVEFFDKKVSKIFKLGGFPFLRIIDKKSYRQNVLRSYETKSSTRKYHNMSHGQNVLWD